MENQNRADILLEEIINDPEWLIEADGKISKKVNGKWVPKIPNGRGKNAPNLNYKDRALLWRRIVYRKVFGPMPADSVIVHLDGNVRNNHPDNLRLLTAEERKEYLNERKHPSHARMTPELARAIREEYVNGLRDKALSEKYQLSRSSIRKIISNHIQPDSTYTPPSYKKYSKSVS
jgi:hypothetical protein